MLELALPARMLFLRMHFFAQHRRLKGHWLVFLAYLAALWSAPAFADARVNFLSRQLERSSDPRARVQAALLLGQTQDSLAVDPLCKALSDKEDIVRIAVAKALAKLEDPSGLPCLEAAERRENLDALKEAIAALKALAQKKPSFYVALDSPDNQAALEAGLLDLLQERLRARLARLGTVFAPPKETKSQATKVLRSQKLKGYLLSPAVQSHTGSGLKLTLLCFSYPERVLKGEISVKASGASAAELIRILAPKAIDDVADEFEWKE